MRGEKPQNRPLGKLNTGRLALRAMLPVITNASWNVIQTVQILWKSRKGTPLWGVYVPYFDQISVEISVLGSYTLLLHRWWWNLARRRGASVSSSMPNFTAIGVTKIPELCAVRRAAGKNHKKCTTNHTNIAWMSMLVWLIVHFYDFCGFGRSVIKVV